MIKRSFLAVLLAGASIAFPAQAREFAPFNPVPSQQVGGESTDVQIAQQAGDAAFQVNQLEEQVRRLNGQLEEVNFQLLQLQEQIRQMQEDNEFRFQELEEKHGGVASGNTVSRRESNTDNDSQAAQEPSQGSGDDDIARMIDAGPQGSGGQQSPNIQNSANRTTIDGVEIYDGGSGDGVGSGDQGLQPGTLGSLTFDSNGNVTGSALDEPIDLTRGAGGRNVPSQQQMQGSGDQASLQPPQGPDELYELGYGYVQAGDYELAEQAFSDFADRYPGDPRYAEARFWLGESLYAQAEYEEAARVFLDAHKKYPQSRLGAQTLLKLASSLASMNQRELACATFAEVPKKYPGMSNAVRSNLEQGRNAASCQVN